MTGWKSIFLFVAIAATSAFAGQDIRPDQCVWFAEPSEGAVLTSPFKVKFMVDGMRVLPSGDVIKDTGHHHLLINAPAIDGGQLVPYDATHLHFGFGQTETTVTLPPGNYTLTAQFAGGDHKSYGPLMSKTINVTVK
jgi:hypothetical protein